MHEYSGDVTQIEYSTGCINIIPQVCNNVGMYGAGLSGSLAAKWPEVQDQFSKWIGGEGRGTSGSYALGQIQWVSVMPNVAVINMVAQNGVRGPTCLLYTSPSPRDRQKSRMPSSA